MKLLWNTSSAPASPAWNEVQNVHETMGPRDHLGGSTNQGSLYRSQNNKVSYYKDTHKRTPVYRNSPLNVSILKAKDLSNPVNMPIISIVTPYVQPYVHLSNGLTIRNIGCSSCAPFKPPDGALHLNPPTVPSSPRAAAPTRPGPAEATASRIRCFLLLRRMPAS